MHTRRKALQVLVCSVLITAFLGCAGTQKKESTGEYIDDSVISAKIKAEYAKDPDLSALQIQVETFKGAVQLSGFVNSAEVKKKAGQVAAGVKGVQSVKNDLIVK